jgi:hypothetical protein
MAIVKPIRYVKGSSRPNVTLTLRDSTGNVLDLSLPSSLSFKLGIPGQPALLTSGIGLIGAATAPNVTISVDSNTVFNTLEPGQYTFVLIHTVNGKKQMWKFPFILEQPVS